jgi:hypothetical protein
VPAGIQLNGSRTYRVSMDATGPRRAVEQVVSNHFDGHVVLRVEHLVPDRLYSIVARMRVVAAPSHVPPESP